jgi:uncharacterized RDD family membrane protein YckC
MNPPEPQPEPEPASNEIYFDPDDVDASEQFFSASLEPATTRPEFVIDDSDTASDPSNAPQGNEQLSGDVGRQASVQSDDASSENEPGDSEAEPSSDPDWRDLVSAKVKHYKTLKPRKERYPSLQLQFDPPPVWRFDPPASARGEQVPFIPDPPSPALDNEPRFIPQPTTETTARVLEFPRPGMLPFNRGDELADPVVDRPRILEAPELVPPPPALGGILIEPVQQPEPERQHGLDMPLHTSPLPQRAWAASIDAIVVAAALAIFGYIFLRFNSSLPPLRTTFAIGLALFAVLWFAYQYALLTYSATTPGLRLARLHLAHFDGQPVSRHRRRWRVLATLLSFVSLGLGYAWCFFDEDQLSWHDRITRTHLAPAK